MTEPLVTVVVPNFNYGQFLHQTLESILNQTYENWEVIVVDNYSTDNSDEVFKTFESDSRFKMIKFKNNGSIAASRNLGIKAGVGDLIAFLDSDDTWLPDKLSCAVKEHQLGANITYHDLFKIDKDSVRVPFGRLKSWNLRKPVGSDLLMRGNAILNSSAVVSRQALSEVEYLDEDLSMVGAEDYNLWLKLARAGFNFKRISLPLGLYRIHTTSTSSRDLSSQLEASVFEFLIDASKFEKSRVRGTVAYVRGRSLYVSGQPTKATMFLFIALLKGKPSLKIRSLYMIVRSLVNI